VSSLLGETQCCLGEVCDENVYGKPLP